MAESAGRHNYINSSWGRRLVAEYTGLNFHEIGALNYGDYLLWLRDAYIYTMNQTEAGREHLDDCWRMQQTEPDRGALREKFGKGAPSSGQ